MSYSHEQHLKDRAVLEKIALANTVVSSLGLVGGIGAHEIIGSEKFWSIVGWQEVTAGVGIPLAVYLALYRLEWSNTNKCNRSRNA